MKTLKLMVAITGMVMLNTLLEAQTSSKTGIGSSDYKLAIGLRAGGTSGLTVKYFMNSSNALEFIAGVWPYGFSATGLFEKHANAGAPGLNWYYGGGAHFTEQSGRIYYVYHDRRYDYYYTTGSNAGLGIDGIIGLEYKIKPIPFAVSLDLKPFLEVNSANAAYIGLDPGLGIKVAF